MKISFNTVDLYQDIHSTLGISEVIFCFYECRFCRESLGTVFAVFGESFVVFCLFCGQSGSLFFEIILCVKEFFSHSAVSSEPNPRFLRAVSPSSVVDTKHEMPVFREFAATSASIPALPIKPSARAASSTLYPAAENIGAATDIEFARLSTSSAELLQAAAKTSA